MAIVTERYVKKPLYVDAVQVTEENFVEISEWCQGDIRANDGSEDLPLAINEVYAPEFEPRGHYIRVRVHNPKNPRQTKAFIGDWLLYTNRGYKVYTDKAFVGSFEKQS